MRGRKQTGQSLAEMALLLPMLMLILMGCLDLGRAFAIWMNLANVAREGARYASLNTTEAADPILGPGAVKQAVRLEIEAEGLALDAVTLAVAVPMGAGSAAGDPVIVTARYPMPLICGFLFGGQPVPISASAQMAVVVGGGA